jgi:DNA processing protein
MSTEASVASTILALLRLPGIGPVRANRMLARLRHEGRVLTDGSIGETAIESLLDENQREAWSGSLEWARHALAQVQAIGGEVLAFSDGRYPRRLKDLLGDNAPPLLFVIGRVDLLEASGIGFCGSRHASEKGLATAADCADQLARQGLNVVSGYAAGVDTAVHRAALAAGGTTSIVLAEGLLRFRHKSTISATRDTEQTVVLSEFAPDAPWTVANAMQRNKTICALSRAMVLIEAGLTGGSISAGKACLAMGLPLFAAVYDGMPSSAAGNVELLKLGAQRLMRNRTLNRANLAPLLTAIEEARAQRLPTPEIALVAAR